MLANWIQWQYKKPWTKTASQFSPSSVAQEPTDFSRICGVCVCVRKYCVDNVHWQMFGSCTERWSIQFILFICPWIDFFLSRTHSALTAPVLFILFRSRRTFIRYTSLVRQTRLPHSEFCVFVWCAAARSPHSCLRACVRIVFMFIKVVFNR